jgi:hypothetical protein
VDLALGTRADAYRPVFDLFEEVGLATWAAEPEVFHAAGSPAVSCYWTCYIEYIDSPLPEIMERLAALWIRAVVDHWGTLRQKNRHVPSSALLISGAYRVARQTDCRPDVVSKPCDTQLDCT